MACKSEETARRALDIAKIWSFENEESYYEEDVVSIFAIVFSYNFLFKILRV